VCLNILQTKPWDARTEAKKAKLKVRSFVIPHIPHEERSARRDAGMRIVGSENQLET